jgi:hypothetical protein
MQSIVKMLRGNVNRHRISVLVFVIVWLIGATALTGGLQGLGKNGPALCVFAAACIAWWGALRLGGIGNGTVNTAGFVVIGLWTLRILFALLVSFRYCITDVFFWASVVMVLSLIGAAAISKERSDRRAPHVSTPPSERS